MLKYNAVKIAHVYSMQEGGWVIYFFFKLRCIFDIQMKMSNPH